MSRPRISATSPTRSSACSIATARRWVPWAGLLDDEALLKGLRHMMTLRAFDARMQMAQRQGKTSFYMQRMGEEAVSCAFRVALEPGDMNFPTYRQQGC